MKELLNSLGHNVFNLQHNICFQMCFFSLLPILSFIHILFWSKCTAMTHEATQVVTGIAFIVSDSVAETILLSILSLGSVLWQTEARPLTEGGEVISNRSILLFFSFYVCVCAHLSVNAVFGDKVYIIISWLLHVNGCMLKTPSNKK